MNISKETLQKHCHDEGLTYKQIGNLCGKSEKQIELLMKKYNLRALTPFQHKERFKKILPKERLEELYHKLKMTYSQIGQKYNKSASFIQRIVKEYGIKPRKAGGMIGKSLTKETKAKISKANKGKKRSLETRKKISEGKKGNKNPNFGKKRKHGKRCWYTCSNGDVVSMRSSWEVCYAGWLNKNNTKWQYEHKTFILNDGSAYTPDFYLLETNVWIEIKGWFTENHKKRIAAFKKEYPKIVLKVLQKKELEQLGIDLYKEYEGAIRPRKTCKLCGIAFIRKEKKQRFCGNLCKNRWLANNKKQKKTVVKQQLKRNYNGSQKGNNNNNAKLKEQDIIEIINLRQDRKTIKEISKIKKTSMTNVGNILNGRSWMHVTSKLNIGQ